ncbi:MAG: FliA/WhiG family RNA polymerase sigma factor [Alphaproteobacteria bacterium]|nr:FliA/WhiG family RNA polymerase sigma factor [Alphaproteobacteria bacterium]
MNHMTSATAYAKVQNDPQEIAERVRSHMPLVHKIAWHIHGSARNVFEIEDLTQIGMVALVEATQRFQPQGEASFTGYAMVRIRGSLTDHLRKNLTLTRLGVQRRNQIAEAEKLIQSEGGDPKNLDLVAQRLSITVAELQSWKDHASATQNKSLDEIYDDHSVWFADKGDSPEGILMSQEMRQALAKNLRKLKEREALVLQLYFVEELNLEEIGEVLSLTVGRVSQIKKAALSQLREWMQDD